MEVYLIRHTTPAVAKGTIYGRLDVALAHTFEQEKEVVLQKLPRSFCAVYASPSTRCTQLAAALSETYRTDERLYEVNFGRWEGQSWDTVDPEETAPWMQDFVHVCPPEGESMLQMQVRVLDFWLELLRQPHQAAAVVTHGGVIRLLLATLQHLPLEKAFGFKVALGEVVRVHINQMQQQEAVIIEGFDSGGSTHQAP